MPRDLILHIGMTKTGSTSIQYLLDINRAALLAQGISYPSTPAGNRHVLLAAAFTSFPAMFNDPENAMWTGRNPDAASQSCLADLQAEIAALPDEVSRIILSAEQFSLYQRADEDIRRLHDFVMRLADRCTVVVYLRRQDEHFASFYSEFLRLGSIHEPDMDKLNPFHHDYDYAEFVGRWARVFGKDNVKPRIFERGADKRFDVIADFAGIAGFSPASLKLGSDVNRNQSMNHAGQDVLCRLGLRLGNDTEEKAAAGPLWPRITDAVSTASPGKGWLPTQAKARAFMDRFAATNESVRAAYFPEKASLFQMDFDGLPEHESSVPLEAVQTATMDAFLVSLRQGIAREVRLLLEKAKLAQQLGDTALQRSALMQAIRLDGKHVVARLRLAKYLADKGDLDGASQQLGVASKLSPQLPQVAAFGRRLAALRKRAGVEVVK